MELWSHVRLLAGFSFLFPVIQPYSLMLASILLMSRSVFPTASLVCLALLKAAAAPAAACTGNIHMIYFVPSSVSLTPDRLVSVWTVYLLSIDLQPPGAVQLKLQVSS